MATEQPTSFDQDPGPAGKGLQERLALLEEAILDDDERAIQEFSLEELALLNRLAGNESDADEMEESVAWTREIGVNFIATVPKDEEQGKQLDVPDKLLCALYTDLLDVFPEMMHAGETEEYREAVVAWFASWDSDEELVNYMEHFKPGKVNAHGGVYEILSINERYVRARFNGGPAETRDTRDFCRNLYYNMHVT